MDEEANEIRKYLDKHLTRKFPTGVVGLRNYIFNTHSKLEDWMCASITRKSFETVEHSKLRASLKGKIMADTSIQVHRLLITMNFYSILKVFLKSVPDPELNKELRKKISEINTLRNKFAHPYGNFDLKSYDMKTSGGKKEQIKTLQKLYAAIKVMEKYLLNYHKEWYLEVSKL